MKKLCNKCAIEKDLSYFDNSKTHSYGKMGYCKDCRRKWKRQRKKENILHHAKMKNHTCEDCGIFDDRPGFFDWHHRDPSAKKYAISSLFAAAIDNKRLQTELAKCDYLCPNCHRIRHLDLRN